jgi:uncharacterized protein YcnI
MSTTRFALRAGGVLAVAGAVALIGAPGAFAHVTANVTTAVQGSYAVITFRVPNEEANAGTVKLQVTFPDSYPIPGASIRPVPGWKGVVDVEPLAQPVKENNLDVKKAVKTITWTADPGTRVNPGEFQEFAVSAGPLPDDTDELQFPAVQTYDDGTVVNWTDQPAEAGQKEPEHPSPSIKLQTKPNAPGAMDMSSMGSGTSVSDTASSTAVSDNTARWLGGAGLLVGAIGLGFGAGAVLRSRRPATAATAATGSTGSTAIRAESGSTPATSGPGSAASGSSPAEAGSTPADSAAPSSAESPTENGGKSE